MSTLPNAADRPWLSAYPDGVPADIDLSPYRSLVQLLDQLDGYALQTQRAITVPLLKSMLDHL